jgi:hypothetical protein
MTPAHTFGAPCWTDLQTPDPAGARRFYAALFGWEYNVMGPEFGGYAMCHLGGRMVCGIGGMPPGSPMPTAWTVYLATENVDATIATAQANGGRVLAPGMDVGEAGRMAILADAAGAVLGVWQRYEFGGSQVWDEPGAVSWCQTFSRDANASQAFYENVFGVTTNAMPGGMDYRTLHVAGGPPVAGILQMTPNYPASMPSVWVVFFGVRDADAAAAAIEANGGTILEKPRDTPFGRLVVAADPFGGRFRLREVP